MTQSPAVRMPMREGSTWTLHKLNTGDAVCIDGSAGGFYVRPPSEPSVGAVRFVIFLEGGGWCLSAADCTGRSTTGLGSSFSYRPRAKMPGLGGNTFVDGRLGREFNDAHLVHIRYCDGASFAGAAHIDLQAHSAVRVGTSTKAVGSRFQIFSSGRAILHASLDALFSTYKLGAATDVLLAVLH